MAVTLEGTTKRFMGLSTDPKPAIGRTIDSISTSRVTTAADIPPGSSFLETDTGRIYRWDGLIWTFPAPTEATVPSLRALSMKFEKSPERSIEKFG